MRGFVAIRIAEPIRLKLAEAQEALRRVDADVRWVDAANLHVTLKFCGEIGEEQAETLKGLLAAEAARWPRLDLSYAGLGMFPEGGAPRVVWAGCAGDVEKLAGLAQATERLTEQVGVPREGRPFAAHLTIGRVKSPRNAKRLREAVERERGAAFGRETVGEFVLFESMLTREGPIYEPRATFPLGT